MTNNDLKFEDILRAACYVSADDEPVECLKLIFPFSCVTIENMYDYETVMFVASPIGWNAIFPLLVSFLSESRERFDENIFATLVYIFKNEWGFDYIISPWLKNKTEIERGITLFQINQLISKAEGWQSAPEDIANLVQIKSIISKVDFKND